MNHELTLELTQLSPAPGEDLTLIYQGWARLEEKLNRLPSQEGADYCLMGIDPAFRKGGFGMAIIQPNREVVLKTFRSLAFFYGWALSEYAPQFAWVCVENSNLQNTSFDLTGTKQVVARKSRNVGANQAVSQAVVEFCQARWGANHVRQLSPEQKGAKWTEVYFQAVMRQERHTLCPQMVGTWPVNKLKANQDERDAYKLALLARPLGVKK